MKPAPAISTLATAGFARQQAAPGPPRACADSGAWPWRAAWRDCWRNHRAARRECSRPRCRHRAPAAGTRSSGSVGRALALSSFSIRVFKANPKIRVQRVGSLPQSARICLIYFQRIDVDGPTQARRARAGVSTCGSQCLEEALQGGACRRSRSADARENDRRAAQSTRWPDPAF